MIVYQPQGTGVQRLHLGVFNPRQFDAFEDLWQPHLPQPGWCLDDFRGTWLATESPAVWAPILAHVVKASQRAGCVQHALVVPVQVENPSTQDPLWGPGTPVTCFTCPQQAQAWLGVWRGNGVFFNGSSAS